LLPPVDRFERIANSVEVFAASAKRKSALKKSIRGQLTNERDTQATQRRSLPVRSPETPLTPANALSSVTAVKVRLRATHRGGRECLKNPIHK
jgi:hypothetical protein